MWNRRRGGLVMLENGDEDLRQQDAFLQLIQAPLYLSREVSITDKSDNVVNAKKC